MSNDNNVSFKKFMHFVKTCDKKTEEFKTIEQQQRERTRKLQEQEREDKLKIGAIL